MNRPSPRTLGWTALVLALLIAGVASFYASGSPDGLESVAANQGFEQAARESHGLFTDYEGAHGLPTWLVRVLGVVVVALLAGAVGLLRRPRPRA